MFLLNLIPVQMEQQVTQNKLIFWALPLVKSIPRSDIITLNLKPHIESVCLEIVAYNNSEEKQYWFALSPRRTLPPEFKCARTVSLRKNGYTFFFFLECCFSVPGWIFLFFCRFRLKIFLYYSFENNTESLWHLHYFKNILGYQL